MTWGRTSLLQMSAAGRLGLALAALTLVWAAVALALA
jgi:Na+/H+-dicarboxylate symporter